MKEKRNSNSVLTRMTPCEFCGFPLSDKHHMLGFAEHGENLHILFLCPNHHALLHLGISAIIFKKKRATEVYEAFCNSVGKNSEIIKKIEDLVYATAELNWEMGIKYSS